MIINPRQTTSSNRFRGHWYPYYAGFSPQFTESVIASLKINTKDTILDPWNGSGTTTFISARLGIRSVGIDINPVMTTVAKARVATIEDYVYAKALALDAIANLGTIKCTVEPSDELRNWFTPQTVKLIRRLELSIRSSRNLSQESVIIGATNSAESLVYLSLFKVVRRLISVFIGTNDTWIRKNILQKELIRISRYDLISEFAKEASMLFQESARETAAYLKRPRLITGSSETFSISDNSIDYVITSPPYCTRIDYAIKTAPELAVIGYDKQRFDSLRRSMMGTTTVPKSIGAIDERWGRECLEFMDKLFSHRSKASSGYYFKSHYAYFDSLYKSLGEISRVLKPNGKAVLVVQDSYYKDLHNDVSKIASEMAAAQGMILEERFDFPKVNSMATLNRRSVVYRESYTPLESVLIFKVLE